MRKWILNIHFYAGLFCAPYLVIFGLSSLNFNHQFSFAKPGEKKTSWESPLEIPAAKDDLQTAEAVRDSLGLLGWPLPWDMGRDASGNFQFAMEQPGKSYRVHVLAADKKVRIEERHKGFWPVFNSLHGLMKVPNSSLASVWGIYTDICTFTVLFAGLSGVYLWFISKRDRRLGTALVLGGILASLAFIIYVVMIG